MKDPKPKTENRRQPNKGFTLIELVIYIAIISIILVAVSYLVLDILAGQSKAYAHLEIDQNSRFIQKLMTSDIKSAKNITSLSADTLVLDNSPAGSITYNFDSENKRVTRQEGVNPALTVNTDEVEVTGNFLNLSYQNRSRNVTTHLEISFKNPGNLPQYQASQSLDFTVELKGRR